MSATPIHHPLSGPANHQSLELHNSIHLRRSQCSAPAELTSISLKVLPGKDLPRLYREKNVRANWARKTGGEAGIRSGGRGETGGQL